MPMQFARSSYIQPRNRARAAIAFAGCGTVLLLTGCGPQYDPLTREGLWRPDHANRANLVMMVANPADLVHGRSEPGTDAHAAAASVERLRADKVKSLPASDIAPVTATSSGGNNSSGAGGS